MRPAPLPRIHATRHSREDQSYMDVYTEDTRRIVAEVYSQDVDLFGYAFDNSGLGARLSERNALPQFGRQL